MYMFGSAGGGDNRGEDRKGEHIKHILGIIYLLRYQSQVRLESSGSSCGARRRCLQCMQWLQAHKDLIHVQYSDTHLFDKLDYCDKLNPCKPISGTTQHL